MRLQAERNFYDTCGIPLDAGYFDKSNVIQLTPQPPGGQPFSPGQEIILARYELPRNYCGLLMSFAQFTDRLQQNEILTPGYLWQIRCNNSPRDPYLGFDHILNPWGNGGYPVHLRLEEDCVVELAIRNLSIPVGDPRELKVVGGRITGRYWYNSDYGGRPNRL